MALKWAKIKKPHPSTKHLLFPLLVAEQAKVVYGSEEFSYACLWEEVDIDWKENL